MNYLIGDVVTWLENPHPGLAGGSNIEFSGRVIGLDRENLMLSVWPSEDCSIIDRDVVVFLKWVGDHFERF